MLHVTDMVFWCWTGVTWGVEIVLNGTWCVGLVLQGTWLCV